MSTVPASPKSASADTVPDERRRLEEVLGEKMPVGILQARAAFQRDLPRLLQLHAGAWVAHSADGCIAVGSTKTEVHQQCLRRGLPPEQFLVARVEPQEANEVVL